MEGTKALRPLLAEAQATVTHLNAHVSALKLQLRHEKDVVQQQRTQREMELQRRVDALLAERVGADDGAAAELTQRLKQVRNCVTARCINALTLWPHTCRHERRWRRRSSRCAPHRKRPTRS